MSILTANPVADEPHRRPSAHGMTSAMDFVRASETAADRIHARRVAAAHAVVTDADFDNITNYLRSVA